MNRKGFIGGKRRKMYSEPRVTRVMLDNSISLVMMTTIPANPRPRGGSYNPSNTSPFESPFKDSTFQ
ncbi:MAG: hypothetical protein ACOX5K_08250 [Bacteroidales bacterium]